MRYPQRLLTEDERVLREFRPHWKVLILAGLWTALAIAAIVVAAQRIDQSAIVLTVVALVVAVWLVVAAPGIMRWLFTQYVLTTERVIVRTGVLARSGTEIPLESVSNVLFRQSVIERLLGYGDVIIESAGAMGQSRLSDIPDPEAFQSEIYRAREERTLHFESGGRGPRDAVAQLEALADLRDRGAITDAEFEAQKRRLLDNA